jgi:hypothetical protein
MAGICRLFRKSLRTSDCVVADAVAIEPVSIAGFPAYREIYREFLESRDPVCVIGHKRYRISITCDEIPYSMEQGIFPTATGNGFH